MISLDRLEIPNLGFSRIFAIARIRYKNRCELINILFNLHQSVHPSLGPYRQARVAARGALRALKPRAAPWRRGEGSVARAWI